MYCEICGKEDIPKDETIHLNLYVNEREGIEVCLGCRKLLSELVGGIQLIKKSAVLRTLRFAKPSTTELKEVGA